jgi:hypothetical protein
MAKRVERRTVDLSGYPDLVVIYLGMRVNRLTGLKTLFGFGPKISNSVAQRPPGLLLHENFIFSYSLCMRACGNTGRISPRSKPGRVRSRIGNGGGIFCATPAEPDSGTRRILFAAGSKPSTMTCQSRWDFWPLRHPIPRAAPCFRRAIASASLAPPLYRLRSPKAISETELND